MSKELAPYFPFYVDDFLSDEKVLLMDTSEIGCYVLLLCLNWKEGSIPTDPEYLKKLCRGTDVTKLVLDCFKFPTRNKHRLRNRRMEIERQKRAKYIQACQKGGRRSAHKVKHKKEKSIEQSSSQLLASESQVPANISFSFSYNINKQVYLYKKDSSSNTVEEDLFYFWLQFPSLLQHKDFSRTNRKHVKAALQRYSPEEIALAIHRYSEVLKDETQSFWLSAKWTIGEFVSRKSGKWIEVFCSKDWRKSVLKNGHKSPEEDRVGERQGKKMDDPSTWDLIHFVVYSEKHGVRETLQFIEKHHLDFPSEDELMKGIEFYKGENRA